MNWRDVITQTIEPGYQVETDKDGREYLTFPGMAPIPCDPDDGHGTALQRLAKRMTTKAVATLARNLDDPDSAKSTAAARELLDRGHGKAPASLTVERQPAQLTDAELRAELSRRLAKLAERVSVPAVLALSPPSQAKN